MTAAAPISRKRPTLLPLPQALQRWPTGPGAPFLEDRLDFVEWWIREREIVRLAKQAGQPKPWSDDDLLQHYRFCCVSRMDDRVSIELMRDWYTDAAPATQLVAAVLARLINWPEALLDATGGRPFEMSALGQIRRALHARAQRGAKCFTGAYLVPALPGQPNKVDSVLDLAEQVRERAGEILHPSLRSTWDSLVALKGLGGFLAGQMTADLAYLATGAAWPDRFSWAPVGPGSARGMNRLRGRPKDKPLSQVQFDIELGEYIEVMSARVPDIAADRRLGAQDWQSTLCEGDKAFRLDAAEGTVRARYDGAAPPPQRDLLLDA
jgi:hypothetical protein